MLYIVIIILIVIVIDSYSSNTVMHIIYVKALVVRRQGSGCFAESKCRRMTSSRWWQSVTRPAPPAPAMSCIVLQSSRHLIHLSTICLSLCPSVTGGSCMFLHARRLSRTRVSSVFSRHVNQQATTTIQTRPISHQISASSVWFCPQ